MKAIGTIFLIGLHNIPEGMAVSVPLISGGMGKGKAVLMTALSGVPTIIGALLGSLLAQYCARRMRMIATIFLLLVMIPLVPGMGLYRCMALLAQEAYREGVDAGVRAMVDIVMIAFGLGMGSYFFRLLPMGRRREQGGAVK